MSGATKISGELQAGTSGTTDSSAMETEEYYNPEGGEWSQKVDTGQLCRVCANPNEYLIPIFDGEGLEHELSVKIEKHLPIKVTETDALPQQMCYQCASTLIAWHDLVLNCVEADKKLRELQADEDDDDDDKGAEMFESHSMDSDPADEVDQPSTSESQITAKLQVPKKTVLSKDKKPKLKMVLVKGSLAGTSGQKTVAKTQVAKALELAKSKEGGNEDSASERYQRGNLQNLGHITDKKSLPGEDIKMDIKIEDCEIEERNEPNHNKEMESENSNTSRGNIMRDSHKTSCFHCGKGILLSQVAVHLKVFHSEFHCHCCNSIVDVNNMNDFRQFKNITEDLKPLNTSTIKSKEITNNNEQNRKNVVHECVICKKRFSNECDLPEHLKQMHCPSVVLNKTKEFQCQFCGLDFLTKSLLKIHLESFHKSSEGQPGKPPVLDIVPLEINVTGELSDSDNFAKEEEEYLPVNEIVDSKEDFEIENIKLSYKFSMSNHKIISNKEIEEAEVVINGKTRYQCKTCEKHLFSRKSFTDHLRIHTGEKPYTCHVCGRQFRLSSQLTRHVQDVHERIKKHPCDICGRKFANGVALRDHKTIHTGERTMLCHLCGKAFKTKAALYMHSKFHAEVYAHPCPHCNKGFRTKEHLNNHMLRHTGERPYACEHCGKRFFMSKTLHNHILIHTNNQTYKCSECGKHFAQERYLKNHERNHRKRALKLNNTAKQ